MDICPCRFMSDGRWHVTAVRLRCPQHENGPPDIKTIDRRRVAPPAGCRVTAEPATVAGRRSAERCTTEEQPNSALHQQRTRQPNFEQFTALAARAWGRRAASRCLGWPGRGAPPVRLSRTVDAYPAPGRGRRRSDAARLHIKLWRVVADIDPPRSDVDPLARSAPVMQPKRITDGTSPLRRSVCITFTGTRSASKHDGFRQVSARHYRHVQHRTGTDHPSGARTRDPGRAATPSAAGSERGQG